MAAEARVVKPVDLGVCVSNAAGSTNRVRDAPMTALLAETALLPDGWAADVAARDRRAAATRRGEAGASAAGAERLAGRAARHAEPAQPCLPARHGRARRARRAAGEDDFWTWREVMYRFVARLGPDEVEAIAAQLYVEMLKAGYTAVGEFHYLHHEPDGAPYADPAEMSQRDRRGGAGRPASASPCCRCCT